MVAFATNGGDISCHENQSRDSLLRHYVDSSNAAQGIGAHLGRFGRAIAAFSGSDAPAASAQFSALMNLDQHGAACRCLLRLRENEGEPGITDAAFIARFLPRYPEWGLRPGVTDASTVFELARELHLAERIEVFRDYERVLERHRAGQNVLVYTERTPEQIEPDSTARRYATLVVEMSDEAFTLWCPFPSGHSDNLPKATRIWWDRWLAIGFVFHRSDARF